MSDSPSSTDHAVICVAAPVSKGLSGCRAYNEEASLLPPIFRVEGE